jgi:2-amino-4-hydroxy-6-hydroxymethyldihydropteridine diphosphokinase
LYGWRKPRAGSFQWKPAQESPTLACIVPNLAYLSLGSNVGDREAQLREALAKLDVAGRVDAVSSFYETEPVEFTQQPWFLNCSVALETSQTPRQLMTTILNIEEEMGRRRVQKKGPRSIDIDILLFVSGKTVTGETVTGETEDTMIDSEELTIPHPTMHQRRFVLEPLAEIAPDQVHPLLKKTIRELRDALPEGQLVRRYKRANDQRPTTNDGSKAR